MKRLLIILGALLGWLTLAAPVGAQDPTQTPPITPTATITATEWTFPAEGLQPFTYTKSITPVIDFGIDAEKMLTLARSALTTYTLMDWQTWALLAIVIMIPVIATLIFKIFIRPPEI